MELTNFNSEQTFSSRFLVEQINIFRFEENSATSLRHDHLIAKIEREFEEEIATQILGAGSYLDANGQSRKCYNLNYEQALQILMSESKTVRKGCIQVMKAQQEKINQLSIPSYQIEDPIKRAEAWIEEKRILQLAEAKNLELQPKADFYDQVTESTDTVDIGTVAKVLGLGFGRTTLFQKLRDLKVLMPNNIPMQSKIDAGWFRVIETKFNKPDGSTHINFKTVVFQKGIDGIRKLLTKPVLKDPSMSTDIIRNNTQFKIEGELNY